ncbi:MAG TPA: winged helix DNA-binding domain-containing protein, partial [Gemmatimonadaceae bacterium]
LRTHVLRPTWHFVDPRDIRWMLRLTGPLITKRMAPYDRHLELDGPVFRRCNAALERALRDGQHLTRAEIKTVLGRARVPALGVQRTAHILMRAELDQVICSGPRRGKQFTYALFDERAPAGGRRDPDEDLLDLTRRYFRTRSPATAQDFSWWSGLPMTLVRRGIDMARSEMESLTIGGTTYWVAGPGLARRGHSAHLLPNYDEFFIGYRDRRAIGERLRSARTVTGGSAAIGNVIVVDGQLAGGWKRVPTRRGITLRLTLSSPLSEAERRRVLREVRRFQAFVETAVTVEGLSERAGRRDATSRPRGKRFDASRGSK